MDTLNVGDGADGTDFDSYIRNAQNEFERTARIAGIAGDPAHTLLHAFSLHLTALRAVHFSERQFASKRLDGVDARLADIRQIQDEIKTTADAATRAAQAEINTAHAKMGRAIVESIALEAKQQFRSRANASWVISVLIAAGLMLLGAAGGAAYGFYWGGNRMAKSLQGGNYIFDKTAMTQGLEGLADWKLLMSNNSIVPVMKECHGRNIDIEHGQKACVMGFWISPPPGRAPAP